MKFRKKPVEIDAIRWWNHGDHPAVGRSHSPDICASQQESEVPAYERCTQCGRRGADHGGIKTLEGLMFVCPGDYVVTGVEGEHYAVKPSIFAATYEPAELS